MASEDLPINTDILKAQNAALLSLTNLFTGHKSLTFLIQKMMEVDADVLGVARVSLWLFDEEQEGIELQDLFERASGAHSTGAILRKAEFPRYFAAIASTRALIIDDVSDCEAVADMHDGYLEPLGISSMLDAPIKIDGVLRGVVCHEHVGPQRTWTAGEEAFAASIADLASQAIQTEELRQTREALRASEARAKLIFSSSPIAMLLADRQGVIVEANDQAATLFRGVTTTLAGRLLADLVPACHHGEHAWQRLASSECPNPTPVAEGRELTAQALDGAEIPVQIGLNPVIIGGAPHVIVAVTDISVLKETETRIKAAMERLRLATDAADIGVWSWDLHDDRIHWDERICAWYEVPNIEREHGLTYEFWRSRVHPEDLERTLAGVEAARRDPGTSWQGEYRIVLPGGQIRYIQAAATVEMDAAGRPFRMIGVDRDVTERKQTEAALVESESRFRQMADTAPVLIWIAGTDKLCTYLNKPWLEFTGRTLEEESGNGWTECVHPQDFQHCLDTYLEAFDARRAFGMEYRLRRHDGEYRWFLDTGKPRYDGQNQFLGYIGSCIDITERKRSEAKLQETQEHYRRLVEDIGDDYLLFSYQAGSGLLNYVSTSIQTIFGISREAVLGQPWMNAVNWLPDAVATGLDADQALLADSTTSNLVELGFIHPDGTLRFVLVAQHLVKDASGQPEAIEGLVQDITERKRTQEKLQQYSEQLETMVEERTGELRKQEALLNAVITSSPNGILLADRSGIIRMTNAALVSMFGYSPSELIGQAVEMLVPLIRRGAHARLREDYMGRPTMRPMGQGLDIQGQRRDGSCFPIDIALSTFTVQDTEYVQATIMDKTESKRAENALRDLNASLEDKVATRTRELELASAAKSEFLANMSHEIRTPMNGILGLAQLLENEPLTPGQLDMVQRMRQSGHLLLGIISDILDFSKIEAGQLQIDPKPFLLGSLLDHVGSLLAVHAQTKGIELFIETAPDLAGALVGDNLRIEQVLVNLIGNAIKFTAVGAVRVRVLPITVTTTAVRLRFEVRDTGVGIDPKKINTLFQPFAQADAGITRRFGGTGLGLSICKRLVEQMGGEIGVDSRPGVGSTFWFELPFERSTALCAPQARTAATLGSREPRLSGLHVLIVDDTELNRFVVKQMLLKEGAHIVEAADGLQALDCLRATEGHRVEVILMDLQMPVMDGYTATRAIRGELALLDIPIIALTAGVRPEQQQAARAAGCNDFVPKPVALEELVAVLLQWTTGQRLSLDDAVAGAPSIDAAPTPLDLQKTADALGGDLDLAKQVLQQFLLDFTGATSLIDADLAHGDRAAAARRLHSLQGAAGYFDVPELSQIARHLEEAILTEQADLSLLLSKFDAQLCRFVDSAKIVII